VKDPRIDGTPDVTGMGAGAKTSSVEPHRIGADNVGAPAPSEAGAAPLVQPGTPSGPGRRPEWLRIRLPQGGEFAQTRDIVSRHRLHTVCESANCPNVGECWSAGTATFMILGNVCTRSCGFCAVLTGRPGTVDREEPERVAGAIAGMELVHAVITSVDRDELPDGGAGIWAETIRAIRRLSPATRVEVLIPDFQGEAANLDTVLEARPDVLGHNVETVPRLQRQVRPQANYDRSLWVLRHAKSHGFITKSGLMLGLGETYDEVTAVMRDLRGVECDLLTLGQYLQPTRAHLPVVRYWHPDEFARLKALAAELGFLHAESGPLVRSSYHAERAGGLGDRGDRGPDP
jgi:lipoyl synthase